MNRLVGTAVLGILLLGSTASASVAINEVAWSGSLDDPTAEWIELVNLTDAPIDLAGWRLVSSDGAPNVLLSGVLDARGGAGSDAGFFLLERGDERSVPSTAANLVYSGALNDAGEGLFLYDAEGRIVDSANAPEQSDVEAGAWPAGQPARGALPPQSMERIDPLEPDRPGNWASATCGTTPAGAPLPCGTPKRENDAFNLPPVVSLEIEPRFPAPGEPVRFDARASTDPNDVIVSFAWRFDDQAIAEGQTASHTFATEGTYEIALTALDSKGAQTTALEILVVAPASEPIADFSILPPTSGELRAGEQVIFQDESTRHPAGPIGWTWDFGDGQTGEDERTTHVYETAGSYTVRLTIVDARNQTAEATTTITLASRRPLATYVLETENLHDTDPARFDASASSDPDGEIASYEWDFDADGLVDLTTDEAVAEFAFPEGGYHAPRLVVVDADGDRSTPFAETLYVNAGPVARFSASSFEPAEAEEVDFSDHSTDPDGTILEWHWDFGDGETSTQTSPSHAFRSSGEKTVTLTVTDDAGAIRSATATIAVANLLPSASLTASPSEPSPTGTSIRFDASASTDPSPDGSIVRYEWDLDGDDTYDRETTTASLSHSYEGDGSFEVTVRVSDVGGDQAISEPLEVVVTNRPPLVERIVWTPESLVDGAETTFHADVSDPDGEVTGWTWTFGDEGSATTEEAVHAFAFDRVYEVTLVIRDDDGTASEPFVVEVSVANASPVASFGFSIEASGTVTFDAGAAYDPSPHGQIVHVAWEFGDGTACPQQLSSCGNGDRLAPVHQYTKPGTYYVTLVVIDDDGGIGRATATVTIR